MPTIHVIYDQHSRISSVPADVASNLKIKQARLDVPEGLDSQDVSELARKLAELLLEHMA